MASRRRLSQKKKGGNCGCQGSHGSAPFLSGGSKVKTQRTQRTQRTKKTRKIRLKGGGALGPASLTDFDSGNKYTYSLFDVTQDPNNPVAMTDARQIPQLSTTPLYGGEKKSRRRRRRGSSKGRKYKGGDYMSANSISNFATTSMQGAINGADIVAGKPIAANDLNDTLMPISGV